MTTCVTCKHWDHIEEQGQYGDCWLGVYRINLCAYKHKAETCDAWEAERRDRVGTSIPCYTCEPEIKGTCRDAAPRLLGASRFRDTYVLEVAPPPSPCPRQTLHRVMRAHGCIPMANAPEFWQEEVLT